jgi:alkanesulfonate monooxygenase SsuD/methylene tetrahydromethanopterin reductase-like flavin-dependent oxidoreductase (luciferase family)
MGALLGPIVDPANTETLAEQARTYAGEGFTSLWTAQAIGRGFMVTDPFVALTVAATAIEEVEVGTAVLQVPLYQTMDLAHRVFSLRQLCGERLILGVGAGSTAQDFSAFERDYESRFATFDIAIEELKDVFALPPVEGANRTSRPGPRYWEVRRSSLAAGGRVLSALPGNSMAG